MGLSDAALIAPMILVLLLAAIGMYMVRRALTFRRFVEGRVGGSAWRSTAPGPPCPPLLRGAVAGYGVPKGMMFTFSAQ